MKNRGLTIVTSLIIGILIGGFLLQPKGLFNRSAKSDETKASTTEKASTSKKRVGVLQYVSHPALDAIYKGIQEGLKDKGYDKNKVEILFQNGQGDQSKLNTMTDQLINQKSDVLIGIATPAAKALANATTKIPIVMGAITDPVAAGLVKDMKNPGGNITGVSDQSPVKAQMELAQKLLPEAKTVGLFSSSAEDNSASQIAQAKKAAEALGYQTKEYQVPSTNEIAQVVQTMGKEVDFIYIPTDNTIASAMDTVVAEANKSKTPVIPSVDTMVEAGGLATIGINQKALGVETGKMAAEILDGKQPGKMPIYVFNTGDTIINQKEADLLGITIPKDVAKDAKIVGGDAK